MDNRRLICIIQLSTNREQLINIGSVLNITHKTGHKTLLNTIIEIL